MLVCGVIKGADTLVGIDGKPVQPSLLLGPGIAYNLEDRTLFGKDKYIEISFGSQVKKAVAVGVKLDENDRQQLIIEEQSVVQPALRIELSAEGRILMTNGATNGKEFLYSSDAYVNGFELMFSRNYIQQVYVNSGVLELQGQIAIAQKALSMVENSIAGKTDAKEAIKSLASVAPILGIAMATVLNVTLEGLRTYLENLSAQLKNQLHLKLEALPRINAEQIYGPFVVGVSFIAVLPNGELLGEKYEKLALPGLGEFSISDLGPLEKYRISFGAFDIPSGVISLNEDTKVTKTEEIRLQQSIEFSKNSARFGLIDKENNFYDRTGMRTADYRQVVFMKQDFVQIIGIRPITEEELKDDKLRDAYCKEFEAAWEVFSGGIKGLTVYTDLGGFTLAAEVIGMDLAGRLLGPGGRIGPRYVSITYPDGEIVPFENRQIQDYQVPLNLPYGANNQLFIDAPTGELTKGSATVMIDVKGCGEVSIKYGFRKSTAQGEQFVEKTTLEDIALGLPIAMSRDKIEDFTPILGAMKFDNDTRLIVEAAPFLDPAGNIMGPSGIAQTAPILFSVHQNGKFTNPEDIKEVRYDRWEINIDADGNQRYLQAAIRIKPQNLGLGISTGALGKVSVLTTDTTYTFEHGFINTDDKWTKDWGLSDLSGRHILVDEYTKDSKPVLAFTEIGQLRQAVVVCGFNKAQELVGIDGSPIEPSLILNPSVGEAYLLNETAPDTIIPAGVTGAVLIPKNGGLIESEEQVALRVRWDETAKKNVIDTGYTGADLKTFYEPTGYFTASGSQLVNDKSSVNKQLPENKELYTSLGDGAVLKIMGRLDANGGISGPAKNLSVSLPLAVIFGNNYYDISKLVKDRGGKVELFFIHNNIEATIDNITPQQARRGDKIVLEKVVLRFAQRGFIYTDNDGESAFASDEGVRGNLGRPILLLPSYEYEAGLTRIVGHTLLKLGAFRVDKLGSIVSIGAADNGTKTEIYNDFTYTDIYQNGQWRSLTAESISGVDTLWAYRINPGDAQVNRAAAEPVRLEKRWKFEERKDKSGFVLVEEYYEAEEVVHLSRFSVDGEGNICILGIGEYTNVMRRVDGFRLALYEKVK